MAKKQRDEEIIEGEAEREEDEDSGSESVTEE